MNVGTNAFLARWAADLNEKEKEKSQRRASTIISAYLSSRYLEQRVSAATGSRHRGLTMMTIDDARRSKLRVHPRTRGQEEGSEETSFSRREQMKMKP